jgi:hypothetical protein
MKTIGIFLFILLVQGISHEAILDAQTDKNEHKPCVDHLVASPACEEDTAAFKRILGVLHVDKDIFLYVSHDSKLKNYGGAMSFRCKSHNHGIYETDENWTIYDPDLIQGDAARDFVFAHEIAHHLNGDTSSGRPRSRELELRADSNGAHYLLQLGWTKARLLHALDLLNLPHGFQLGYPTLEERKAIVKTAAEPWRPPPPTIQGSVIALRVPAYEVSLDKLLNLKYQGPIRFQSVRTKKYVCSIGTPDPKIPSTSNFAFFDNCEQDSRGLFDLGIGPDGTLGYWIQKHADPCPDYAVNCRYVLESVGDQLQFWNQNLAADRDGWEKELGEQELYSFEASEPLEGLVRIKAHKGGYIFVDPKTAKLQSGGSREQAAEFRVQFDFN